MSLTSLYLRDSKNNLILVEIDVDADSEEIGRKIKAAFANPKEGDLTPTVEAFPPLDNSSLSPPAGESSAARAGVAPGNRDGTKVPSPNDLEKINQQEEVRSEVRRWLSTSDIGDPEPREPEEGERQPLVKNEEQSNSKEVEGHDSAKDASSAVQGDPEAGEPDHHSEHTASQASLLTPEATPPATADEELRPLTDKDPFFSAYEMTREGDEPLPSQFTDRPYPKRLDSTANANSMTYHKKAAEWDNISTRGTVGSKKTIESIYDGSSIKDLSLSESKNRERGATFTDKVKSMMPKRSSSKLGSKKKDASPTVSPAEEASGYSSQKHGLSVNNLVPPEVDSTPMYLRHIGVDTNGYLTTADRRTSDVPDTASSTTPFHRLRRSFSKGEKRKSFTETGSTPHIVGLMRKEGGPPVSTALVSPLHEHHDDFESFAPAPAVNDDDNHEDEDDEYEEDGGADSDDARGKPQVSHEDLSVQVIQINPDLDGFRTHALQLNPNMDPYLADRIAQEQVRRYEELVGHKVRHEQDIHNGSCASGPRCLASGGQPAHLPARSNSKGEKTQVFFVRGHPDSAEAEANGATLASFQQGIPEPPVSQLPATFECSLCFKERKGVQKPSDWTKHVHEDLQPFTCTFKVCSTEKKSFKRKADWVRHENECHRHLEEWRCNYAECQHVCYRSDNFSQHLIREHKVPDFKDKSRGSTSSKIRARSITQNGQEDELITQLHRICRSTSTAKPESEPCAFCGLRSPNWKKHQVHLSKHMESIAMPVLGLVKQKDVLADTAITPIKREQVQPLYRSHTNSDVTSRAEPHILTPYSTNGSNFHHSSSASQSPLGAPLFPHVQPQYSPYPANSDSLRPASYASQSSMGEPQFVQQQTSSPMGGGAFGPLGYGASSAEFVHMDNYNQNDSTLQADPALYHHHHNHHPQMQFTAVNSTTASTYPPSTLRRSPAQNQLQPPTSYPITDQMASHEYASSPHSGRSQYNSSTPSPHQMRASPMNHQLEIPRSQAMGNQIPSYSNGEFTNTYTYTEQPAPFQSPLEAESYPDSFHRSIEAQDFIAATAALGYNTMTATTMPMEDAVYDVPQFGNYSGRVTAPHSQAYHQY
jgi:hypothetical protein